MNNSSRKTIVILKMHPNSPRATEDGFLTICASGYGREISQAERELNAAIEESEAGKRNLIPLHRLRAERVYSKATSLEPIESVVALIHKKAGKQMEMPERGFFDIALEDAIRSVDDGLVEYPRMLAAKKKRQAKAKKARDMLNAQKRALQPIIEEVVESSSPHPEELRNALAGIDGKPLQTWTEKQLALAQKAKKATDAKRARDQLNARKRALRSMIEDVVINGTPHPEELRDVLDGLDGKNLQAWAEKQLARLQRTRKSVGKRADDSLRLRELTVERAKGVEFDVIALREIQREIATLADDDVVLTESEEHEYWVLENTAREYYYEVEDWRDELPVELQDYALTVLEVVKDGCPLAGSFDDLVRHILIDNWDEHDDAEDWLE